MATHETDFEKRRGVNRVEVKGGFSQVHVTVKEESLVPGRLRILKAVTDAEVSLDFLKLTPVGMSFLVPEAKSDVVEKALSEQNIDFTITKERSIVLVHAVNIRDEEGLIASIVQAAIASGAKVDHIGDMHDRMLMVISSESAQEVATHLKCTLMEGSHEN